MSYLTCMQTLPLRAKTAGQISQLTLVQDFSVRSPLDSTALYPENLAIPCYLQQLPH